MKLLLDTNAWYYCEESPNLLGKTAATLISDTENQRFISAISSLEIGQLLSKKRIRLSKELNQWREESLNKLIAEEINITHRICVEAYNLPEQLHPDPADRILIATARIHGFTIITSDRAILDYGFVNSIDAKS